MAMHLRGRGPWTYGGLLQFTPIHPMFGAAQGARPWYQLEVISRRITDGKKPKSPMVDMGTRDA